MCNRRGRAVFETGDNHPPSRHLPGDDRQNPGNQPGGAKVFESRQYPEHGLGETWEEKLGWRGVENGENQRQDP